MENSSPAIEVTVSEAKKLLDAHPESVLLIDVREPDERRICAIPGAQPIPLAQIPDHLASLPKDKHLLMHCHHGARSMRATQFLRANGFTHVSNVAGGIEAWAQQIEPGMPRY